MASFCFCVSPPVQSSPLFSLLSLSFPHVNSTIDYVFKAVGPFTALRAQCGGWVTGMDYTEVCLCVFWVLGVREKWCTYLCMYVCMLGRKVVHC